MTKACIVSRFEEMVNLYRSNTAIVFGEKNISYGKLDSLSRKYATWFKSVGVEPLDKVLVDLPRSDLQLIAQIALLRIGAIFVPRNTDIKNFDDIILDCHVSFTITDGDIQGASAKHINISIFPNSTSLAEEDGEENYVRSPDQPIVILTTSGTTGKPKYLLIPSRSHVNLLVNNWYCKFDQTTRILYHSPASFDAATVEVWSALLNGGTVVVSEMQKLDIEMMYEEIVQNKVNTIWLTSAIFSNLVNLKIDFFTPLSNVMTGGDTVNKVDVEKFKKVYPEKHLVNCWGPAENGTFSACAVFEQDSVISDPLQIGKQVNGVNVYVIADDGEIVTEPNIEGRLYVNGKGIFLGYVNAGKVDLPLIYQENIDDPIYDTGDYGFYSDTGEIQFLGRKDDLVKINGKRIYLSSVSHQAKKDFNLEFCYAQAVGPVSNRKIDLYIMGSNMNEENVDKNNWEKYHEDAYKSSLTLSNKNLFAGWVDPYSGKDVEESVMQEWQKEYVGSISALSVDSFIDIGCGTGMAIDGLEHIDCYLGIDISAHAIDFLKEKYLDAKFDFIHSDANTFLEKSGVLDYDITLINSVINYFDNKYQVKKLFTLLKETVDNKYIYLGDLINYDLADGIKMGDTQFELSSLDLELNELEFPFSEIYSLLTATLGEVNIMFTPKLCADRSPVFMTRYDVIIDLRKDRDQRKTIFTDENIDTIRAADICNHTVINIGSYQQYIERIEDVRTLIDEASSKDLNAKLIFDSCDRKSVSIVIADDPFDYTALVDKADPKKDPRCLDLKFSNRMAAHLKEKYAGVFPIRNVNLLYYLPPTTRGKIDRSLLGAFESNNSEPTETSLEKTVCDLFEIAPSNKSDSLFEIGITSLQIVRIGLQLEKIFGITLAAKDIYKFEAVDKVIEHIKNEKSKSTTEQNITAAL